MLGGLGETLVLEQDGREEELEVGRGRSAFVRTKATASPRFDVSGPRPRIAQLTRFRRDSAVASVSTPRLDEQAVGQVVEQVRSHSGRLVRNVDPDGLELCTRADSGQLQRVRRADGAGAEDDFALGERFLLDLLTVESVGDPESTPALQEDAGDERTGHHGEIRSPPCQSR